MMIRSALLAALILSACTPQAASKSTPSPTVNAQGSGSQQSAPPSAPSAPRNFVCERLHVENEKAICQPEYTDVGELHAHSARVTIGGQTVSCAINVQQVSVVCGALFYAPPPPPATPDKAAPKVPQTPSKTK